ncbi:MAG: hypothetical protein LBD43_02445 [Holosporales bacterium]|jgi:hypothetical protein|nr:hypothetical protein [Holosporales bacterium]
MLRKLIGVVLSVCALVTMVNTIKIGIGGNVGLEPIAIVELDDDPDARDNIRRR